MQLYSIHSSVIDSVHPATTADNIKSVLFWICLSCSVCCSTPTTSAIDTVCAAASTNKALLKCQLRGHWRTYWQNRHRLQSWNYRGRAVTPHTALSPNKAANTNTVYTNYTAEADDTLAVSTLSTLLTIPALPILSETHPTLPTLPTMRTL